MDNKIIKDKREGHGLWRTLLCAFLALCPIMLSAAEEAQASGREMNRHFIILFDELVGTAYRFVPHQTLLTKTEQCLNTLGYRAESDYVSVGGYGLNLGDPNFDSFINVYSDSKGEPISWRGLNDVKELGSLMTWVPQTARWQGVSSPGSMQSLAKHYGLMAFKRAENEENLADETYVILITDEVINGSVDSYQDEWDLAKIYNVPKFNSIREKVFSTVDGFNRWLDFDLIEPKVVLSSTYKNPYVIATYRVRPKLEPAIGASVVLLTQVRRSRGGYNVGFLYPMENASYRVGEVHFNDNLADDYALQVSDDAQWVNLRPESRDIDSLVVTVDVHFVDGYYNGIRFSGLNPHYYGLKIKQKMMMFDEPKILGFFHMPNLLWWWFPNDIYAAVHVWDLIIILIILVTVCYAFYKVFVRITTYKPKLKNIEITNLK
ncbi:MAG: hypothetical protein ACI4AM_02705 [Muribaculaceae bacterium]